jgi:hypothetical protein
MDTYELLVDNLSRSRARMIESRACIAATRELIRQSKRLRLRIIRGGSTNSFPAERRAARTRDKTLRNGLPRVNLHDAFLVTGDGRPCDGCGDTIPPSESRCQVTATGGISWRFHQDCYNAWMTLA